MIERRQVYMVLATAMMMAAMAGEVPVDEVWKLEAPRREVKAHVPGFIWVEAENFASYGGWILDTQFAHKMGSGYLLAPGVGGNPVAAASTELAIPESGVWRGWVRTKDWLPAHHPGRFTLTVDGKPCGVEFGASGKEGWTWERAGDFRMEAGKHTLELKDVSGAYARCDAVLFTRDLAYVPPEDGEELAAARARFSGEPAGIAAAGDFDVAVVGGGPAGVPAAIAASRHGARTVLIHDRPVFGGNISSELGVLCNGASGHPGYREGGIIEEAVLGKAHEAKGVPLSFSRVFARMIAGETNLVAVKNARVIAAETGKDGAITGVIARDPLTGARTRFKAKYVIDCTGDGWVGYFAGAKYMFGREAAAEYGEACAPETADLTTMSGCLLGGYGVPRFRKVAAAKPWVTPGWAYPLPEGFTRKAQGLAFKWWLEHPGDVDDCADPEFARDELVRIFLAYWGWLNHGCQDAKVQSLVKVNELQALPYMNGRREGMRLKGDHVFTANDALECRMFEDRIGHTGWPLDTHDPLGITNPRGNGFWKSHPKLPVPAPIPYRSLYSVNVPNLFMAGRCVSCTHAGLGTLRVVATCAVMGQAVGTAAAGCARLGISPREYGRAHIRELQLALMKDDQFIPEMRYDDPANLARKAKASASSEVKGRGAAKVIDGFTRTLKGKGHSEWQSDPKAALPQTLRLDWPEAVVASEVRLVFNSDFYLPARWVKHEMPTTLVKAYKLECTADGENWSPLADEGDNFLRLRIHRFERRRIKSLRLTVTATTGDLSARVFEVEVFK